MTITGREGQAIGAFRQKGFNREACRLRQCLSSSQGHSEGWQGIPSTGKRDTGFQLHVELSGRVIHYSYLDGHCIANSSLVRVCPIRGQRDRDGKVRILMPGRGGSKRGRNAGEAEKSERCDDNE